MAAKKIFVSILSENGKLFEGNVDCLFVPSKKGEVAILPYHTPLVLLISQGSISILEAGRRVEVIKANKGLLRVDENVAFAMVNL